MAVEDIIDGSPPKGALSVGPVASNTEFEDDIDGGAPKGAVGGSGSVHHRV
jgi:hypothetical protein